MGENVVLVYLVVCFLYFWQDLWIRLPEEAD